jgi:hypothetical protein
MPSKKTSSNISILMDENEFLKAKQASNKQDLEDCLIELMERANKHYDAIYLKYKNNPDIEKFSFCMENFKKIKSIIEQKEPEIITQLTKKFHLEAWISTLYSDIHALNLQPETEKQLNELNEKIHAVETDFNQLLTKISSLDSNDKSSARLLNYIDDFQKTWESKKNILKGHYYYNFAETLIEKGNEELETNKRTFLEDAKHYFIQSADFYKQGNLLEFEAQTKERIKKLELTAKELLDLSENNNFTKTPSKKLVIVLTKLSPSSIWAASYPQSIAKIAKPNESRSTLGNKRKSFNNTIFKPVKKLKTDRSTSELEPLWNVECEKILNEFNQLNIAIDLAHLSNNEKSFDERRAIAHNNYAIFLIEDLNNAEKNYSDSKKIAFLKKVEELLKKSAEFYKNANLSEKKDAIEQCISNLRSSLTNLEINIKDASSIKTEKCQTKPIMSLSDEKYRKYQHTYSTRYVHKFFKDSSSVNHTQNTNRQSVRKICLV